MKFKHPTSRSAFSIIELMVGIFIFTLGLVSVFALLMSSLSINEYNKNAIIASNLAREEIELFHNIRDTNYKKLNIWNQINPLESYTISTKLFSPSSYYTLENNQGNGNIDVIDITSGFQEGENNLTGMSMKKYRLCLNGKGEYIYCDGYSGVKTETPFYRYLYIEPVLEGGLPVLNTLKITSKVIWNKRGYHEYDIKTILTDWRRI